MRFTGLALAASAIVLVACGGGEPKPDSTAGMAAAQAAAAAPTGTATYMTPTGQVHEVKMSGSGESFKFDPEDVIVKEGDAVKFIAISGMPHNISFDPAVIPDDVEPQLAANMPNTDLPLTSPYLMDPNASYTISFAGIKPGTYPFFCVPHSMYNMKGSVTVQ
jgi:plastocyanin